MTNETESDPCEKCGAPVYGYVERRCCDGRECGCMGRPLDPCWCDKCWADYDADAKRRAAEFANVEWRKPGPARVFADADNNGANARVLTPTEAVSALKDLEDVGVPMDKRTDQP